MPTYEYQCLDCKHKVEYFQSMKEAPRTVCQRCGGKLVRLVSSGAGLIFKGSGFYVTDYKRKEEKMAHRRRYDYDRAASGNGSDRKERKEKETAAVETDKTSTEN